MHRKTRKGYQAYLLVKAGTHSQAEAARECGVSSNAVSYECRKHGLSGQTARGRERSAQARVIASLREAEAYRRRIGVDPLKVVELVSNGLSYSQVGSKLGLTRNQVAGFVFRHRNGVQYGAQAEGS